MSLQEVDKLSKALKDDEFRKLFFDYAKEISDPENKQVRSSNECPVVSYDHSSCMATIIQLEYNL